ncbi:GlxA family transcriptional regulator [Ancylobacter sonchi]|uniref:GlxA family transcriptional regulator n=1 Tax=Ancylobacter sonchi TaxID=1937790 RepID=UPI001BD4CA52|nr:GlxA family transcriptional regulator [Ancylobacter sonchi]MBS7532933.1 GlxA family transcriptional regulator [Ancylobacter sonchi]
MRPTLDLASIASVGFLTLPNHSMVATVNALEALRMANYVSESNIYSWHLLTPDAAVGEASNGLSLSPARPLAEAKAVDLLLVCGGIDIRHAASPAVTDALRRHARRGTALGALCTGSFVLAEAGLLDHRRCAIHWENLAAIREEFQHVDFIEAPFVIDGDRLTCTGGVAPMRMMLALIAARCGRDLADRVAEQFILEPGTPARRPSARPRPALPDPTLARAVRLMQATLEEPPGIAAIARRIEVSPRQLERLFRQYLGATPTAYHLGLRLDRARELLRLSTLPVTDVGLACGFRSAAHFSTAYTRRFGRPPRAERAAADLGALPMALTGQRD